MTAVHRCSSLARRWPSVLAATLLVTALVVVTAAPATAEEHREIDEWGRDPNVLSGSIEQVCGPGPDHDAAAQRPGRVAIVEWLDETFPEVDGFGGFGCREVINSRSSCAGRIEPDASSCWSTHAAGRAIDVMVGGAANQDGEPQGKELGDEIVNHLLATVDGVANYRARVMGIQQLLWDGRCWSTAYHDDDRVTDINELDDDCVGEHDNHIHITLSEAGADGLTSFHNGGKVIRTRTDEPVAEDVGDPHLVLYEGESGKVLVQGLDDDGTFTDVTVEQDLPSGFTALAAPDVAGNGDSEVFAYRKSDGDHLLREIRGDGELGGKLDVDDELDPGFTVVAAPDVDGDGDDELLLYSGADGRWVLHELHEDGSLGPELQPDGANLDVFFSGAATPDLDGDGDDELLLYRRFDGHHAVMDFTDADELAAQDEDADPDDESADSGDEESGDGDSGDEDGDAVAGGAPLDEDRDGEIDVAVTLARLDLTSLSLVTEADDGEAGDGEAGSTDDESDVAALVRGSDGDGGLGAALTAGFTGMGASDIDADGIDELALYRRGDGCLAIRHLEFPVVDSEDADEPVQPCLNLPKAAGEEESDREMEGLDPDTWVLESRDDLEPGWSALLTASVG